MKSRLMLVSGLCFLSVACATPGGGPLGIVAFDPDQHVSSAEPLFGKGDATCLDDPTFLLTLYSPTGSDGPQTLICHKMRQAIGAALPVMSTPTLPNVDRYTSQQRNEVIDALMAASDRKCGRYIAFLQQYDANVNSTFGIATQAAATLAAIATGGTAQALAAAAGIAGGTRNTLNQSHFNNQTIGVLANAFENGRSVQRTEISALQSLPPGQYTLMRGIQDATRYHSNCSIVVGLKEAQRSVEEAHSPSLSTMTTFLTNLQKVRGQMDALLKAVPAVPVVAGPPTPAPALPIVGTPGVTGANSTQPAIAAPIG